MASTRMVACSGWRFHKFGTPERVLQFEKFRVPFERKSDQVVVKMLAAPVHKYDANKIDGSVSKIRPAQFPAVAGVEGVGVVDEVGTQAQSSLKEGDLVYVNNPSVGTFASHIVTTPKSLDVMPNRADIDIENLAIMSIYHTAYHLANDIVKLEPGDTVLQTGAFGSLSQATFAFMRLRGVKPFAPYQHGRANTDDLVEIIKKCGAYGVFPHHYSRTKLVERLLSDVPPPKLLLNHINGPLTTPLFRLLADNATVCTYGNVTKQPIQASNLSMIRRGLKFRGFSALDWLQSHSKESRMRLHQDVIESLTGQAKATVLMQRFKMDTDSPFAFDNAFNSAIPQRKSILRMVGEYGEWRQPTPWRANTQIANAVWNDWMQEITESMILTDDPKSMKFYIPTEHFESTYHDAKEAKEVGLRDAFLRRPSMPRHNTEYDLTTSK